MKQVPSLFYKLHPHHPNGSGKSSSHKWQIFSNEAAQNALSHQGAPGDAHYSQRHVDLDHPCEASQSSEVGGEPLRGGSGSGRSKPGVDALPRTSAPQVGTVLISVPISPAAIWMTVLAQDPCHYIRLGLFTTSRPAHTRQVLIRMVRSQSWSKQMQLHQKTWEPHLFTPGVHFGPLSVSP